MLNLTKTQWKESIAKSLGKSKKSKSANTPINLTKHPIPGRNDPCPLHPEVKLKNCKRGCLNLYLAMRSQAAGDIILTHTEDDEGNTISQAVKPLG